MQSLPLFLITTGRTVILIGQGDPADAKRRLIEHAGAQVVGEDGEARIALVATDAPEPVVARLRARGILVNVADRPDLCDFFLPAIIDRDPVIVAIGTGGVSAGFAAALRQRLEQILPANLGRFAERLRSMREVLVARVPDPAERRRRIGAMLAPGGPLDPLAQTDAEPDLGVEAPARVERLSVRSADPDELTLRAARLLGLADRIYYPAGVPPAILDRARADAVRIVGRRPALLEPGLSVELVWMPE